MKRSERSPEEFSCAGCGKVFDSVRYGRGSEFEIAPGVIVRICFGRGRYLGSPVCAAKAITKAALCPGCGAENTRAGKICAGCKDAISRGKSIEGRQLEWWGIAENSLGPYLCSTDDPAQAGVSFSDQKGPLRHLAHLLVAALASGRTITERHTRPREDVAGWTPTVKNNGSYDIQSDGVYIELLKGQGPAFTALCDEIRRLMRLEYRKGWQDGNSLLKRLATGDRSIRDYDTDAAKEAEDFGDVDR